MLAQTDRARSCSHHTLLVRQHCCRQPTLPTSITYAASLIGVGCPCRGMSIARLYIWHPYVHAFKTIFPSGLRQIRLDVDVESPVHAVL